MKTHLQIAQETHSINQSYFDNRLLAYVLNTLVDTISDRYMHADDSESLSLHIGYQVAIAKSSSQKFCTIYMHPLWEVSTFEEFQAHKLTIDLVSDDSDKYLQLDMTAFFDFAKLTLRASADADYFMSAVAACLAANKVTVHADAFALKHNL